MNIHAYNDSLIIDAILTILNISVDLAIGHWLKGEISARNLPYYTEVEMSEFKIGLFCTPATPKNTDLTPWKQNQTGIDLVSAPTKTFMKDFYYIIYFRIF